MGGGRHETTISPAEIYSIHSDGKCHCDPCQCKHKLPERVKANEDLQKSHLVIYGKGDFTTTSSDYKAQPIPNKSEFAELKKNQIATHFNLGSNKNEYETTNKNIFQRPHTVPVVNEGRRQKISTTSHIFQSTENGDMVSISKISFTPIDPNNAKVLHDKSLGVFLRNSHFQFGHGNKEMTFTTDIRDNFVPPPYAAKLSDSPEQVFAAKSSALIVGYGETSYKSLSRESYAEHKVEPFHRVKGENILHSDVKFWNEPFAPMETRTVSREAYQAPSVARDSRAENGNYKSSVFKDTISTDYTTHSKDAFVRKPIDKNQKENAKKLRNHLLEPHIALGNTQVEYKSLVRDTFTAPPEELYRNREKHSDPSKKDNIVFGSESNPDLASTHQVDFQGRKGERPNTCDRDSNRQHFSYGSDPEHYRTSVSRESYRPRLQSIEKPKLAAKDYKANILFGTEENSFLTSVQRDYTTPESVVNEKLDLPARKTNVVFGTTGENERKEIMQTDYQTIFNQHCCNPPVDHCCCGFESTQKER